MTDTTVAVPNSDAELSKAAPHLTIQEKLLLAQAVYKLGAVSWPGVSNLLIHHPCCVARPADLFSAEKCESAYVELMTSIGINIPAPDAMKPQAKVHLRLAQTFYLARMQELQAQIASYEARFSQLMKEISALRAGEMDGEIRAELRATLARKYGKKLLDTWVPDEAEVKMAIEQGPVKEDEAEEDQKDNDAVAESVEGDSKTPDAQMTEGKVDVEDEQLDEQTEVVPETTSEHEPIPEAEAEVDQKEVTPLDVAEDKDEVVGTPHSREPSSAPSARSELSPAPGSDLSPAPSEKRTPTPAPEIEPASNRRSYKRRASTQPHDAPAPKRSGRRSAAVATTPQPETEAEVEAEAEDVDMEEEKVGDVEAEAEAEEKEVPATRGRRGTRRDRESSSRAPPSSKKPQNSPSASTRTKDSSPAISRRAPSVSSVTSATQEERRSSRRGTKGRAMRNDVVSKSVREQSAAVESVKAEDDDEVEDAEKPTPRTTRRRGTIAQETPVASEKRGTRATAKTAHDDDNGDDDNVNDQMEVEAADVSGDFSESKTTTASTPIHGTRASASRTQTSKGSQKVLLSLLDTISSHRNGNVFQNPVKKSDAPAYYEMIKRPMDLKTIRAKIKEGQIATIDEFERDTLLIFANAMMFNGPKSHVYAMAKDMLKDAEAHIRHFKSVQHHVRG